MILAHGGGDHVDNILQSIKKMLGIQNEYNAFDQDILIHINTAFSILNQLNIGPDGGSEIDEESTWDMYVDDANLTMIKTFIYLKVKLIFDPPSSSVIVDSINRTLSELEFRLYVEGDSRDQ